MKCGMWALLAGLLLASPTVAQVQVKQGKDALDFMIGNELAARYHTAGYPKPILWPLNAPGNVPLTRSWPMVKSKDDKTVDHPHQMSAYFTHGDVIPEGLGFQSKIKGVEGVDFWSVAPGHGIIATTLVGEPKVTKDSAQVLTKNEWRTADGTKILDETRTVTLVDLGKARLFIFDIDLHASVCPITFGDTKEGAMGIRINDEIRADKNGKGKIQNAEGKVGEKECWGHFSAWCDYSGPIDGKVVGLTLLADPKNPQPSAWHVRGYGLMAANPFGRIRAAFPATKGNTALVKLAKGQHLQLRYGILAHEGDAEMGQVAKHYQKFVDLRK